MASTHPVFSRPTIMASLGYFGFVMVEDKIRMNKHLIVTKDNEEPYVLIVDKIRDPTMYLSRAAHLCLSLLVQRAARSVQLRPVSADFIAPVHATALGAPSRVHNGEVHVYGAHDLTWGFLYSLLCHHKKERIVLYGRLANAIAPTAISGVFPTLMILAKRVASLATVIVHRDHEPLSPFPEAVTTAAKEREFVNLTTSVYPIGDEPEWTSSGLTCHPCWQSLHLPWRE